MPGFDGTGPMGMGPMTGGGFGYCAGGPNYGYGYGSGRGAGRGGVPWGGGMGRAWGGGRGWGRGRGMGWGGRGMGWQTGAGAYPMALSQGYPVAPSQGDETNFLTQQLAMLKEEMEAISRRLEELAGKK